MINEIKGQKLRQSNTDTFVTGGTLGDMYIVFCKLFDYHRKTGKRIHLIRYSCTTELNGVINQLFKLVPYIELEPCRKTNSNNESVDCITKAAEDFPFISQTYHGRPTSVRYPAYNRSIEGLADPKYIRMEPFPTLDVPVSDLGEDTFHVGVQLRCGSLGRNFRGFTLKWLVKLSRKLKNLKTTIHILGAGDGYEKSELMQLDQIPNIRNWAGVTNFLEWLSLMKSMNTFISLEGFPAFFAMSQKVPTILYDQFIYGIENSIHPSWREKGIIIRTNRNVFTRKIRHWKIKYLKQKNLYSPHNLQFVKEFIHRILLKEMKNEQ